jgi:hypothetical protein
MDGGIECFIIPQVFILFNVKDWRRFCNPNKQTVGLQGCKNVV